MRRTARRALGISRVVLRAGEEVSAIAGAMHEAIAWHRPLPYRIVGGSFGILERMAAAVPVATEADEEDDLPEGIGWRRFHGAVQGVIGDTLAGTNNPLAGELGAHGRDGRPLDLAELARSSPRGVALFVHGLCGSDADWKGEAHQSLVAEWQAAGVGVAWLRYNTGRAVGENGRDLARLLERARSPRPGAAVILVGHSMGGLVIRSACAEASARGHAWLGGLTHAVYLGTPHGAAPLERAGHWLQTLLGSAPYAAPLARAGDLRSRGITDLRVACDAPWPSHVRHVLVAGTKGPRPFDRWIGDGMVPLASALAEGEVGAPLERRRVADLGHLGLLTDPRVYAVVRETVGSF